MSAGCGLVSISLSMFWLLGVATEGASAQTPPRPPVIRAPTAPKGVTLNPTLKVDAKVPVVASIQAPMQMRAGSPFQVVVRLQQADAVGSYPNGGCVVRIQGRNFESTHFGALSGNSGGKHYRDETVEVVANSVGPANIEVTPFTYLEGGAGRAFGAKVARDCTALSETPLRRANRNGVRNGARLTMTEPTFMQAACSADGRAIFALVGNARDGFGLARYDTSNGAETAYLPLASFQLSRGVLPCVTYERQGHRVFVATGRLHATEPHAVVVIELDADTLSVNRVVHSGPLRVSQGNNAYTELSGSALAVRSGRDAADIAVLIDAAYSGSTGAVAWFDMREPRCAHHNLIALMADAAGAPGLSGQWIRSDKTVMGPPLAADRLASIYAITMLQAQKVVEVTGAGVRHFEPGRLYPNATMLRVDALAGVSSGKLYALTDLGIVAYSLNLAVPTPVGASLGFPPKAGGQYPDFRNGVAVVHNGRVLVGGGHGLYSWQIATNTRSALDESMLSGAGFSSTITNIMPTTPNDVILQLDTTRQGQNAGDPKPAEFLIYLLR